MSLEVSLIQVGINTSDLDEVVHDASSKAATNINMKGMSKQLEYLKQTGMSDKEIINAVGIDV
jgi:predicted XRE-type DNA-binding protein